MRNYFNKVGGGIRSMFESLCGAIGEHMQMFGLRQNKMVLIKVRHAQPVKIRRK